MRTLSWLKQQDDILLQHIIILECLAAWAEQVDMPNCRSLQYKVPKSAVIRSN